MNTTGRRSACTAFVNSLWIGSRMCYRLIRRTPVQQTPCLQQESTQKELAMRRRVSLSVHRGLHAPGDEHIRSRYLFRVYPPHTPPFSFSSLSGHLGPTGAAITLLNDRANNFSQKQTSLSKGPAGSSNPRAVPLPVRPPSGGDSGRPGGRDTALS